MLLDAVEQHEVELDDVVVAQPLLQFWPLGIPDLRRRGRQAMKHNGHESRSVPILCPAVHNARRVKKVKNPYSLDRRRSRSSHKKKRTMYYTPAEPEPSPRDTCFRRDRGPVSTPLRHAGWRPWSDRARVRDRVDEGTSFEPKKGRGVRALAP